MSFNGFILTRKIVLIHKQFRESYTMPTISRRCSECDEGEVRVKKEIMQKIKHIIYLRFQIRVKQKLLTSNLQVFCFEAGICVDIYEELAVGEGICLPQECDDGEVQYWF